MKSVIAVGWLLGFEMALGQGTVNFANDSATLSSPPDRLVRFSCVSGGLNTPAYGTNFQVQLYYGASTATENDLIPVSAAPARLRVSTSTITGTWSLGGMRTLSGFNFGSTVKLQVRLWDINYGTTYEQAYCNTNNGSYMAVSAPFVYAIPATATNPPRDFAMANFTGICLGPGEDGSLPRINSGPQSQTVAVGQTVTFNVSASDFASFRSRC